MSIVLHPGVMPRARPNPHLRRRVLEGCAAVAIALGLHLAALWAWQDAPVVGGAGDGQGSAPVSGALSAASGDIAALTAAWRTPPMVAAAAAPAPAAEMPAPDPIAALAAPPVSQVPAAAPALARDTPLAPPAPSEAPRIPEAASPAPLPMAIAPPRAAAPMPGVARSGPTAPAAPAPARAPQMAAPRTDVPPEDAPLQFAPEQSVRPSQRPAAQPAEAPSAPAPSAAASGRASDDARQGTVATPPGGALGDGAARAGDGAAKAGAAAYGDLVRAAILRRRAYPRAAQRRGWQGKAVLALSIGADGGLTGLSLAQSSGRAALDDAALGAARAASPFAPPPAGAVRFSVPIVFSLR